jgi:hypothetical protein
MSVAEKLLEELRKDEKLKKEIALELLPEILASKEARLAITRAIIKEVTTKDDIKTLEASMKSEIEKLEIRLRNEMRDVEDRLKNEIVRVEKEVGSRMDKSRSSSSRSTS